MRGYRFLLDEHMPPAVRRGLVRLDPGIEVLALGEEGAPPLGAQDPEIIQWLDANDWCLVTNNRRTMPAHLGTHLHDGGHVRAVFALRVTATIGVTIEELHLIWSAADPYEYADRVTHIPLRPQRR